MRKSVSQSGKTGGRNRSPLDLADERGIAGGGEGGQREREYTIPRAICRRLDSCPRECGRCYRQGLARIVIVIVTVTVA